MNRIDHIFKEGNVPPGQGVPYAPLAWDPLFIPQPIELAAAPLPFPDPLSGQKSNLLWLAGYGLYQVITVFVGGEENNRERFTFRIPKMPIRLLELAKFLYSELNQR